MYCTYLRWDPESDIRPVADVVLDWAATSVTPPVQMANIAVEESYLAAAADLRKTGEVWAVEVQIPVGAEEAVLSITTVLDLATPPT